MAASSLTTYPRVALVLQRVALRASAPYNPTAAHLLLLLQHHKRAQHGLGDVLIASPASVSRNVRELEEEALATSAVVHQGSVHKAVLEITFKGEKVATVARKRQRDAWRNLMLRGNVDPAKATRIALDLASHFAGRPIHSVESELFTVARFLDKTNNVIFDDFKQRLLTEGRRVRASFAHPAIPRMIARLNSIDAARAYEALTTRKRDDKQTTLAASLGLLTLRASPRTVTNFGGFFLTSYKTSYEGFVTLAREHALQDFLSSIASLEVAAVPRTIRSRT